MDCIFCKIVKGEIPATKVFEDDKTLAFMDIAPLIKGHTLVIPKNHAETVMEVDPDDFKAVGITIKKVIKGLKDGLGAEGVIVLQLNGKAANQVVPHYHVHLIPRWSGDGLRLLNWKTNEFSQEEMSKIAQSIKDAIGN